MALLSGSEGYGKSESILINQKTSLRLLIIVYYNKLESTLAFALLIGKILMLIFEALLPFGLEVCATCLDLNMKVAY